MSSIYKESKFNNGLSIITAQHTSSPLVAISVYIKAGAQYESPSEYGYAHVLEHMLVKQTEKMSAQELGVAFDRMGAYMNAHTTVESISLQVEVLKKDFKRVIPILSQIVRNPLFDDETLENEKKVILEEWNRFSDNKSTRVMSALYGTVFGGSFLSRNPLGDKSVLEKADVSGIRSYYEKNVVPSNVVILISGDLSHDSVTALVEEFFVEGWNSDNQNTFVDDSPKKNNTNFIKDFGAQTNLFFNYVCRQPTFHELICLEFVAHILGYGKFPILKQKLRHETGLVYAVGAYVSKFRNVALLYISTATSSPLGVIPIVREVLSSVDELFVDSSLEDLKEQFKNVLLRKYANSFLEIESLWIYKKMFDKLYSLDEVMDEISSIQISDIRDLQKKYLSQENLQEIAFGENNPFLQ